MEEILQGEAMEISLKDLSKKLEEFAKARDWEKFHSPRNLLLAMVMFLLFHFLVPVYYAKCVTNDSNYVSRCFIKARLVVYNYLALVVYEASFKDESYQMHVVVITVIRDDVVIT